MMIVIMNGIVVMLHNENNLFDNIVDAILV